MPTAIGNLVFTAAVKLGASLATAATVANVVGAGIKIAGLIGVAVGAAKLAQDQYKQDRRLASRDINIRSGAAPQHRLYGRYVVGGLLNYYNQRSLPERTFDWHTVLTISGHEVQSIDDIYLDDVKLEGGVDIDWANNRVDGGGSKYDVSKGPNYAVEMWRYLGTDTQAADPGLVSTYTDWTSAHRNRGNAYVVLKFRIFNLTEELYRGGAPPQQVRVGGEGFPDIYDPRLDVSPGANPLDPAYQQYTRNPILIAANYAVDVMKWSPGRIDWDYIATVSAPVCDVLVDTPGGQEPRYAFDGMVSLGVRHGANLETILASCLGRPAKVNGKWRFIAGDFNTEAPVQLGETDIVGQISLQTASAINELYNVVRGTFYNDESDRVEQDFPDRTDPQFVIDDGGQELTRNIQLIGTIGQYQAQRIAHKHLLQGREQEVVTVPLRWSGLRAIPGSRVQLSYDRWRFVNKEFRALNTAVDIDSPGAPLKVTLRSDDPNSWADLAVGEYAQLGASSAINPGAPDRRGRPREVAGEDVNNWSAYVTTFPDGTGALQMRMDRTTNELFVRWRGFNLSAAAQVVFELELIGPGTVTGFTDISLEAGEEATQKGSLIDFNEDFGQNLWDANGMTITGQAWSVGAAGVDECSLTLSGIDESTQFRIRLYDIATTGNDVGALSFGDQTIVPNGLEFRGVEYWFTARDNLNEGGAVGGEGGNLLMDYTPGTSVLLSMPTERGGGGVSFIKVKEWQMRGRGTFALEFDIKSLGSGGANYEIRQGATVLTSGGIAGTNNNWINDTGFNVTLDNPDDPVSFWVQGVSGDTGFVRNVDVKIDGVNGEAVVQD